MRRLMMLLLFSLLIVACNGSLPAGCPPSCLSGVLNRLNLSERNFTGTDFSGAFLNQANLSEANLSQANLSGADLSEANLSRADLSDAILVGANLSHANLTNAILEDTNLSGANLTGAILTGLDLTDVKLNGVSLEGADLVGTALWGADLSGIHFSGADLSGANLVGADLSGAIFSAKDRRPAANLSGADLRDVRFNGADLRNASLRGASIRNGDLTEANLAHAQLSGTDFTNANLKGANLKGATLSGASFVDATLPETNLLDAQLNGTSLQGAQLNQARLRERVNEIFLEADFLGAKYDHLTQWPTWLGAPANTQLVDSSSTLLQDEILKYCGDKSKLDTTLNMTLWAGYMDEGILTQFEIACGVTVLPTVFSTNEELMTLLIEGTSDYDLMILSDYAVQLMSQQGLLAELNKANFSNINNLKTEQMGLYYDPENKYSLPYQWGMTGIALNTAHFSNRIPNSWSILFDLNNLCQYDHQALMLGVEREAIGAALTYLGYSYNDIDPAHHKEAERLLRDQKECLSGYDFGSANEPLVVGDIVLAHTWSNTAAAAHSGNPNITFLIPKEGGAIWQDNMVIPADSKKQYTVEVFMNYLLDAAIGARLTSYTYAFTPNQAAEPLLAPQYFQVLANGGLLIDDKIRSRLQWIEQDPAITIFFETWQAVQ